MKNLKKYEQFLNESLTEGGLTADDFQEGNHYRMTNLPKVLSDSAGGRTELFFSVNSKESDYLDVRLYMAHGNSFDDTIFTIDGLNKNNIKIEDLGILSEEQEERYWNGKKPV